MAGYTGSKPVLLSTTAASVTGDATIGGELSAGTGQFDTSLNVDGTITSDGLTVDTNTLHVDSTNNRVGIWTTSPGENLHVAGGFPAIKLDNTDSGGNSWRIASGSTGSGFAGKLQVYNEDTATVAMMIESSGNLLVGKSSANNTVVGIEAKANGNFSAVADGITPVLIRRKTSNGTAIEFAKDGTTVGSISVTGSATAYNTSSDYRLKENITPVQNAGDIVKAMRPVTYTFKSDGSWHDGFLAHELQELHPRAVIGEKDAVDEEGNPEYQGVDYSKLTPILTAALQEALTEISDLKTRVAALEAV